MVNIDEIKDFIEIDKEYTKSALRHSLKKTFKEVERADNDFVVGDDVYDEVVSCSHTKTEKGFDVCMARVVTNRIKGFSPKMAKSSIDNFKKHMSEYVC